MGKRPTGRPWSRGRREKRRLEREGKEERFPLREKEGVWGLGIKGERKRYEMEKTEEEDDATGSCSDLKEILKQGYFGNNRNILENKIIF